MAKEFANNVNVPFSFLLNGSLGSGKTTFTGFFITSLLENKKQNIV
ncbi:MAG: hypothetical protein LBF70_02245, partial [Holosporales bacterium]|nr:hypothetical protein [Holosporales bacterium]